MSEDKGTTFKVGKRNGRLIVLVIDTRKMIKVGILNGNKFTCVLDFSEKIPPLFNKHKLPTLEWCILH